MLCSAIRQVSACDQADGAFGLLCMPTDLPDKGSEEACTTALKSRFAFIGNQVFELVDAHELTLIRSSMTLSDYFTGEGMMAGYVFLIMSR